MSTQAKTGDQQAPSRRDVWRMFDRIAPRYDLLNHLLSLNRDKSWRKRMGGLLPDGRDLAVLDLASGTGDQLLALHESGRVAFGVGLDMAAEMLAVGIKKIETGGLTGRLAMVRGDASAIPFADCTFDAVSITFGIRNLVDVRAGLAEMFRVLKPGGRALILEFSLPGNGFLRRMYLLYFRHILPRLGAVISGDSEAYRYLNRTVETFPYGEEFCALMRETGFGNVAAHPVTFGIATIYRGDRP
ncbi:bifunctional demethylmenaquinone methyltransferase/2-methoxy-6-polyprenyl-1,4-benzoquinol methylase UbiE [candidate division GN15 bacterium]|uniref:Demethylmenaquinone methyltransferase n=1 Tax=candidate division GN15 bacterium TaxID=2072418 RepID=A0A855X0N1_9BACT|nr:MAG: bifunctional demethylmenaquinone methyltransferase/2-methoxy-6-polyprenyl-1,4-benzoquinol methylase UbiE [candidate division GN15 bacterium]